MIVIIYGTTGELIKLLPLIKSLPSDEQFRISTQQQPRQLAGLQIESGAPEPDLKIANGYGGHDLEKIPQLIVWMFGILKNYRKVGKSLKKLKKENHKKLIIVVHGDTVTTVLGALFGRLHHLPVAHIEAGLRSGNWRHPFPEEIDRRIVSKIATKHFAPGDEPAENLELANVKGEIINTSYNTVLDSLRLAQTTKSVNPSMADIPKTYFLVSIHRNELMAQSREMRRILEFISEKAKEITCVFLDHPVTKEKVRTLKLDHILENPKIIRLPKLHYYQFISLAVKSQFIVTDSGGLQEESAYLGIPCLVHRLTTERTEGLGKNVVLSHYEDEKVKAFLNNPNKYRTNGLDEKFSPTDVIVKSLRKQGFLS